MRRIKITQGFLEKFVEKRLISDCKTCGGHYVCVGREVCESEDGQYFAYRMYCRGCGKAYHIATAKIDNLFERLNDALNGLAYYGIHLMKVKL